MNKAILLCIVLAQFLPRQRALPQNLSRIHNRRQSFAVATADTNRAWRAATNRGLTMGNQRSLKSEKFGYIEQMV